MDHPGIDITSDGASPPPRPRKRRQVLAVGALLLLALGLWARGLPSFVAWELARDHQRCFGRRQLPARVWSDDPRDVQQWLESRGTPTPLLPPLAHAAELVGARYCPLQDRVVAHVYYGDDGGGMVSVFLVPGPVRLRGGWSGTARGMHVRLLRAAGRVLAVVGASEADVEATARSFTTTVAGAPATGGPLG